MWQVEKNGGGIRISIKLTGSCPKLNVMYKNQRESGDRGYVCGAESGLRKKKKKKSKQRIMIIMMMIGIGKLMKKQFQCLRRVLAKKI